jgi:hypothetical protein
MKNKLDQHIDTKLKTSFDAIQKKAPEHVWEQISEEMNIEDALNTSLDEKIQTAHLDMPLQKAPSSIWDNIDDALDETTPVDAILDEKVKDGFLSKSKAAPVFLWGAISEELNTPPASVDATLDDKLKEGFLRQETKKTPNKVWYAVSRQLNIDKTWDRINKALDKEPVVSDWSGRIVRFVAIAALLLLLLKTCTHRPYTIPNPDLVHDLTNSTEDINKPLTTIIEKGNTNSSAKKQRNSIQNNSADKPLKLINSKDTKSLEKNNNNLIGNVPTSLTKHSSKGGKKETTQGRIPASLPIVENYSTENSEEVSNSIAAVVVPEALKEGSLIPSTVNVNTKGTNKSNNESIETINQDENITQSEGLKEFNPVVLDALTSNPLTLANGMEPIQLLEEVKSEKKANKNLIDGKLEAGAFAVVNSTMLLNNETREGFDQNSLTTNYFGLAANYGIWASYRILPKGALVAEFSINADNRQAYGTYDRGVFYIKEWVMKYNRFSLAYKHDLWQTNSDKLINTKVVAQAGVYLGMMREAKLFYDGVLFFDKQSDYHQFDFGFKLALGQEILIDKFVLGYGIRSDIGASNIFKGNNQLNGREDQTNIIHLGGYVLFGYRF